MTWLGSGLKQVRSTILENPGVPITGGALMQMIGGEKVEAGVTVNEKAALGNTTFWRGVTVLAETVGSLRLLAEDEEGTDIAHDVLTKPHQVFTMGELITLIMYHRLLHGDAYLARVPRGGRGSIEDVWLAPLNPLRVKPRFLRSSGSKLADDKVWDVKIEAANGAGYETITLNRSEIIQIPGFGFNGLVGMGLIDYHRQSIGGAIAADRQAHKFYGKGTLSSGFLRTDKKLEEPDAKALKRRWQEKIAGIQNASEVAVLDMGTTYEALSIPPEQAQFLQSREFNVLEMARITGVPPHLLMSDKGARWGSGLEQETLGFNIFSLRPHLTKIQDRFTEDLLPAGERARFLTEPLERGDTRTRWGAHLIARKANALSVNEIRRKEGEAELDDPRANDPFWTPETSTAKMPANEEGGNEGEATGEANVAGGPSTNGNDTAAATATLGLLDLTTAMQKIYLAVVNGIITVEESREFLNRAGAGLPVQIPEGTAVEVPGTSVDAKEADQPEDLVPSKEQETLL